MVRLNFLARFLSMELKYFIQHVLWFEYELQKRMCEEFNPQNCYVVGFRHYLGVEKAMKDKPALMVALMAL